MGSVANPYDPGHPFLFWLTILALIGGLYAGGKAVITSQDCRNSGLDQEWSWFPPEWQCIARGQ